MYINILLVLFTNSRRAGLIIQKLMIEFYQDSFNIFRSDRNLISICNVLNKKLTSMGKAPVNPGDLSPILANFASSAARDYMYSDPITEDMQFPCDGGNLNRSIIEFVRGLNDKFVRYVFEIYLNIKHERVQTKITDGKPVNRSVTYIQQPPSDEAPKTHGQPIRRIDNEQLDKLLRGQPDAANFPYVSDRGSSAQNSSYAEGYYARGMIISNEDTRVVPSGHADRLLESWKYPAAVPGRMHRDDPAGGYGEIDSGLARGSGVGEDKKLPADSYIRDDNYPPGVTRIENFHVGQSHLVRDNKNINRGRAQSFAQKQSCEDPPYANVRYEEEDSGMELTPFTATNNSLNGSRDGNNKLWVDGDGFVDQSDPEAMQRLFGRNVFRSLNTAKQWYNYDDQPASTGPHTRSSTSIQQPYSISAKAPSAKAKEDFSGRLDNAAYWDKDAMTQYKILNGDIADNQIPWYRKALHRRNYEKDVDESLAGFERDNVKYAYDTDSLKCRLRDKINCGEFTFEV